MKRSIIKALSAALFASVFAPMATCPPANAQQPKTNIVMETTSDNQISVRTREG